MLNKKQAYELANHWIESWNTHDLKKIMSHYAENVEFISPIIVQLLGDPAGRIHGKYELEKYFAKGLKTYPNLNFKLLEVLVGVNSLVIYYINFRGTHTAEYIELDELGKIIRVSANYGFAEPELLDS